MIVFVSTEQHRYTNRDLVKEPGTDVTLATYDDLFSFEYLPRAAYVFTDLDRLSSERLEQASRSFRMLRKNGLPAYNDPARFLGRYGVLRRLHQEGINAFNAYRVDSIEQPVRWPVFIRAEGDHKKPLSGLLHSQDELDLAIAKAIGDGAPLSTMLIIEYPRGVAPAYSQALVFSHRRQMFGFTADTTTSAGQHGKPEWLPTSTGRFRMSATILGRRCAGCDDRPIWPRRLGRGRRPQVTRSFQPRGSSSPNQKGRASRSDKICQAELLGRRRSGLRSQGRAGKRRIRR